jgi:CDP-paratose 2-epimerase
MERDIKMNILVTGAAGFIGNAVWERFKNKFKLIGIDNLSRETAIPPVIDSLQHHLLYVEDITNIDKINLPKLDLILHLAAQVSVVQSLKDPIQDLKTNAEGTLKMCLLAQKNNCKLIYSSTNKVFGELQDKNEPILDSEPQNPQTPYGISKYTGAKYVLDLLPTTGYVFHQSCIYGDNQIGTVDQGWVGWLKYSIKNNIPITCFGDGTQIRDLLNVSDLIDLYEMVIDNKIPPGEYVIGGGEKNAFTFKQVVDLLGGNIQNYQNWRSHDQKYFVSANKKINNFGWYPKINFKN